MIERTISRRLVVAAGAWMCLLPTLRLRAAEPPAVDRSEAGALAVDTLTLDWLDRARDRQVPAKIYYPAQGAGPFPVIVFSHGLGGTREGYEYLGRQWASHGYVSVHIQHRGSDELVWKGSLRPLEKMRKAAKDVNNSLNRPADVRFAIDQVELLAKEPGPLAARLDLKRLGVAGHSFGGWTALAVAGQVFTLPGGRDVTFADPRVKAAIPMSAPVPQDKSQLDRAFGQIKIPCLYLTGTADDSPIGETSADQRRLVFDHASASERFLVTFNGGDHLVFAGPKPFRTGGERDPVFHKLIRLASTTFWDAYLKGQRPAKEFLTGDGYKKALGEDGVFEVKLKGAAG